MIKTKNDTAVIYRPMRRVAPSAVEKTTHPDGKAVGALCVGVETDAPVAAQLRPPAPQAERHANHSERLLRVPKEWVSDQCGGEFDDMTAGQGYRRGWNDCRDAMLASSTLQEQA